VIRHVWTAICSRCITDTRTGNISLIDAIEQIKLFARPASVGTAEGDDPSPDGPNAASITFEIVTLWSKTAAIDVAEQGYGRLLVKAPSGVEQELVTYDIDLSKTKGLRAIMGAPGFPIVEDGEYLFCVEYRSSGAEEWQRVSEVPLDVVIATEAPGDA